MLPILFTATAATVVSAIGPPEFLTPARGWSALYGAPFKIVNETIMKLAADGLNSSGLLDYGYEYVSLDDWYISGRNAAGDLQEDIQTFPSGMAALGEHIHAQGCKYGVYSSASLETCGSRTSSLFTEQQDANLMANDWQIDMLKYDSCLGQAGVVSRSRYYTMGRALNKTGRTIRYSVEGWSPDVNSAWGPEVANMWRVGSDIWPHWDNNPNCILNNLYTCNHAAPFHYVGKGFNDPDMLQPPNTLKTVLSPGLSPDEAYSQFKLWVIMKSPLQLSVQYDQLADLKTLEPAYYGLLTNLEFLAINSDQSLQARVVAQIPSSAQQASGELNITLQTCDDSRQSQRFDLNAQGQIQLQNQNLCLGVKGAALVAAPCATVKDVFSLQKNDTLTITTTAGQCVTAAVDAENLPNHQPSLGQCEYNGPLPMTYEMSNDRLIGEQIFVWGSDTSLIYSSGLDACLTVGYANYPFTGTNEGTLNLEVWAGPLTPDATTGAARRVIALFNKGLTTDSILVSAEILGTDRATGNIALRDVEQNKDLAPLVPGQTLAVDVVSHGVTVYVLTGGQELVF